MATLGAALAGVAAHAIALGQSVILASGAVALLPATIGAAVGIAIAAKSAFGGLGEAWKQTGAAASAGGGAAVDVAHRVKLAHRAVRDATQALSDAQRDAIAAQESLTRARESAAERLEDMSRSLRGARLDERSAMLAVEEARRRLSQARGSGDSLEIRRAQLAYEESVHTLEEVRDRVADLGQEQADASAKGVEGSDEVQSAIQRQEQAQRSLTAATERLADAQRELAQAGKGVGGAASKAKEALAALAPSAAATVLALRALAPSWRAAGKAGQQATFAGVADDFRALSGIYLPSMTAWFGRMGGAFNNAMRSTFKLAQTSEFARDVDLALGAIASTTTILARAIAPFVNGFMQFVTVGSSLLPGIAGSVGSVAERFERWAIASRESGRMQEWMTTGLDTLKQFWELSKNLVMSVVAIFSAGENAGTLEGLVAGSAAMRAWLESAEGQQKVADVLGFLRGILTDLGSIVPAFTNNSGALFATLSVGGAIMEFLAGHMDTFASLLPTIIAAFIVWKGAQAAANMAMVVAIPLRIAEFIASVRSTSAMWAHTAALRANTLASRTGTVSTVASTVATTAGDVATKRSLAAMAAMKVATLAGAAATGIATAAQWLWNIAVGIGLLPILFIVAGIALFIAAIIFVIKYHKEFPVWIGKAWDFILEKIKAFGNWLWNDLAPMVFNALTWPYRMAWQGIQWVWGKIQEGAQFASGFVIDRLQALVGFVTSMPGKVAAAVSGLWNGLVNSAKAAFNSIAGFWNRSLGNISFSVPNWVPTLGGNNFSIPKIPLLDVGGDIRTTGLAVVHQGERVVPAAQVSSLGSGGSRDVVELRSDGSALSDWIVELLRKAVRDRGGDVQFVLGR
ncbi:MAG TPA: hypothetical protein DGT23_35235 [Micromonosporaceae bacterium]|nr:hypothetical protein [Micromonosporaceae bacterium]